MQNFRKRGSLLVTVPGLHDSLKTLQVRHTRLLSMRKHQLDHEVIAACVRVDGAAAWLGRGTSSGQ